MSHVFQAVRDAMLMCEPTVRAYHKPLHEPVYVVEPARRQPRGTIVFIHGLLEHPWRFFRNARRWAEAGWQVVLPTLRGHGVRGAEIDELAWLARAYLNQGDPTDVIRAIESHRGRTPADHPRRNLDELRVTTMDDHLDQIREVVAQLAESPGPRGPLVMAGHSLGGLLACAAARQIADDGRLITPTALLMLSPALRPTGPDILTRPVVKLFAAAARSSWAWPAALPVEFAMSLPIVLPTRWGSRRVSDIADEQRLHQLDPINGRHVPTCYLRQIHRLIQRMHRRCPGYPLPTLSITTRRDCIVDGASPLAFARRAGTQHRHEVISIDEVCAHELTRASCAARVHEAIDRWLDSRLASAAGDGQRQREAAAAVARLDDQLAAQPPRQTA